MIDAKIIISDISIIFNLFYFINCKFKLKLYLEQTFHHPPVSHYYMIGPNKNFIFHGYSNFSSSAGLNSLKLLNKGKRYIQFKDGTKISTDFCYV